MTACLLYLISNERISPFRNNLIKTAPSELIDLVYVRHYGRADYHHRYKACMELGVEPVTVEHPFESLDEAILYALEHQDNRRNQTETQKALNAVKRNYLQEQINARKREALGGKYKNQYAEKGSALGRDPDVEPKQEVAPPRESETQRALNAVEKGQIQEKIAAIHRNDPVQEEKEKACAKIAKQAGVGTRTVERIVAVINKGHPALENMMRNNLLSADAANLFVQNTPLQEQS